MARTNLSLVHRLLKEYEIQDVQVIPSECNPKNSRYVVYNGKQYSSAQWGSADIKAFCEFVQGKNDLYSVKSVAQQKISTAHGYNADTMQRNYNKQERTYADGNGSCIQLYGRSLIECLNDVIHSVIDYKVRYDEGLSYSIRNMIKARINYLVVDEYDEYDVLTYKGIEYKEAKQIVFEKIRNQINNKELYTFKGYIIPQDLLYNTVKNWCGENDIKTTPELTQNFVDKYMIKLKEVA